MTEPDFFGYERATPYDRSPITLRSGDVDVCIQRLKLKDVEYLWLGCCDLIKGRLYLVKDTSLFQPLPSSLFVGTRMEATDVADDFSLDVAGKSVGTDNYRSCKHMANGANVLVFKARCQEHDLVGLMCETHRLRIVEPGNVGMLIAVENIEQPAALSQ